MALVIQCYQTSSKSSSNIDGNDFSFKYTGSSGLTARYLLISFDSKTSTLTSSTDISGSDLSQKSYKSFRISYILHIIGMRDKRIIIRYQSIRNQNTRLIYVENSSNFTLSFMFI